MKIFNLNDKLILEINKRYGKLALVKTTKEKLPKLTTCNTYYN